jgi:hypothetical protein
LVLLILLLGLPALATMQYVRAGGGSLGAFALLTLGAAGLFVVALAQETRGARQRLAEKYRELLPLVLRLALFFLVFYVIVAFILSFVRIDEETRRQTRNISEGIQRPGEERPLPPLAPETTPPGAESDERPLRAIVTVLAVVLGFAAAVLSVRYVRRLRAAPDAREGAVGRLAADLRRASRESLRRMLDESDDRRAVIAAYALVEDTFARHGHPRKPHQTPMEFMADALDGLVVDVAAGASASGVRDSSLRSDTTAAASDDVGAEQVAVAGGSLMDLTRLYELARFSLHPVGGQERRRAMVSLERIETELLALGPTDSANAGDGAEAG